MELLHKAVALAPGWGIAHVWYADSLIDDSSYGDMNELSIEALREYKLAISLDPSLTVPCLEGEAMSYGNLKQNTAA